MRPPPFKGRETKLPPTRATVITPLSPELIWASISDEPGAIERDASTTPDYTLAKSRYGVWNGHGVSAFWNAAQNSWRLLILDLHFTPENMRTLQDRLGGRMGLTELRLITGEKDTRRPFSDLRNMLESLNPRTPGNLYDILVIERRSEFLHDRFAVTGNELWHFGGTVGGLEKRMTAVSRGWNAETQNFITFFNHTWKNLASKAGGGSK